MFNFLKIKISKLGLYRVLRTNLLYLRNLATKPQGIKPVFSALVRKCKAFASSQFFISVTRLKIEKYLFYLLVFAIPFQIRIFVYEWGAPKDEFFSAFFYFTDALILSILIFWVFRGFKIKIEKYDYFLFTFLFISFLSVLNMKYTSFGFYQILKLLEFVLLYFYTKSNMKYFNLNTVLYVFVFSGVFQALLGIFQFLIQGSLGFKYLGETTLSAQMSGVAKIDTASGKIMRPYGTFTHPNVLAAFLFFSLAFFYFLLKDKILKLRNAKFFTLQADFWFNISIFFVLFLGFFLTFSRSVFLVFTLFSLILFLKSKKKSLVRKYIILSVILFLIFSAVFSNEFLSRVNILNNSENLNFRMIYKETAVNFISENTLLGIGPGNFVNTFKSLNTFSENMPWAYQPVHNTYFLIASEVGVFGFLFFLAFLIFLIINLNKFKKDDYFKIIFLGVLFSVALLFFSDHYFWDLQQGKLMFWIFAGILAGCSSCVKFSKNEF